MSHHGDIATPSDPTIIQAAADAPGAQSLAAREPGAQTTMTDEQKTQPPTCARSIAPPSDAEIAAELIAQHDHVHTGATFYVLVPVDDELCWLCWRLVVVRDDARDLVFDVEPLGLQAPKRRFPVDHDDARIVKDALFYPLTAATTRAMGLQPGSVFSFREVRLDPPA